jgi:multicomponent Na+:H+ antiporter subunit G
MTEVVGSVLIVTGAAFAAVAGLGALRFYDVLTRMHAATKATTLALLLVASGSALHLGDSSGAIKLLLAVALVFITAPIGAHLVGRAAYRAPRGVNARLGDIDELAARQASMPEGATERADAPPRGDGAHVDGGELARPPLRRPR